MREGPKARVRKGSAPPRSASQLGAALLLLLLALATGAVAAATGVGGGIDESLRVARDGMRAHPASGRLVIVEIDARSIAAGGRWPWPRGRHGALIDRLTASGVTGIAFDIDFSAPSDPAEDMRFAAALARQGGSVVLPTFRQASSLGSAAEQENLPIPVLASHGMLGAVNVTPERDGQVRHYDYGQVTAGQPRPSIAAMLAHAPGEVGSRFRIDQATDPATIPRVSFIDVVEGRVDRDRLAGRAVLVGATAIELGDRYAVPRHGVLPGVVVQALATETLTAGADAPDRSPWPLLLIAVLAIGLVPLIGSDWRLPMLAAIAAIVAIPVPLMAEIGGIGMLPAAPALLALAAAALSVALHGVSVRLRRSRLTDAEGMANVRALVEAAEARLVRAGGVALHCVVVRIGRQDEVVAALDRGQQDEVRDQIVARIGVVAGGDIVYRVEAGVYACLIEGIDAEERERTVSGLAALLQERFTVAGLPRRIALHIGSAEVGDLSGRSGGQALLDAALHASRSAEETQLRHTAYSAVAAGEASERFRLTQEIDAGLASGEFVIALQPKVALASGVPIGAEALARWNHPVRGLVSPAVFMPLIEREGWLDRLTLTVLDRVIAEHHMLAGSGEPPLPIAFNISARQIADRPFMDALAARIAGCGIAPAVIAIEITESDAIGDVSVAAQQMERLRALGCPVAIDDYGTGQATLSYIQRFPADEVKIDQSFVRRLTQERADQILVRSTIDMAHLVGLKVVAEGVEDEPTAAMLRELGCDAGQGWLFARPMPAEAYRDWLAAATDGMRAAA